jgi:hypothetical protein
VAAELHAAEQAGQLTVPLTELALSYLHMHANRLLRAAQRAQELVLYDFLERFYESQAARARQAGQRTLTVVSHPRPAQNTSATREIARR